MTSINFDPNIMQFLDAANDAFNSAEAEQGFGGLGQWPEKGQTKLHEGVFVLDGIRCEPDKWKFTADRQKHELDAIVFQPQYLWKDTTTDPKGVWRQCKGNALYILKTETIAHLPAVKGNNKKWLAENFIARVKGHLCGIFNCTEPELGDNLGAAIRRALELIANAKAGGTSVGVDVYTEYDSYKKTDADTAEVKVQETFRDFIRGCHTSTPA